MLFKFRYPKLTLLVISIIFAYILFTSPNYEGFILNVRNLGYLGVFIAGLLFPLGFTAAFSVGFFVTLNPENLLMSGLIGAFGAMVSNLLIFHFIKCSFEKEFFLLEERINRVKMIRRAEKEFRKDISKKIRHYMMYIFIGILIASPLPDEIADIILAGFTKVKSGVLAILSLILHFIGITILLWI